MAPQEIGNPKLDRILEIVEKDHKRKWVEKVCTILLSLATISSAWCIYQSSRWNGEQYFRIDDENVANQLRVGKEDAANLRHSAELQYFLLYMTTKESGNKKYSEFLKGRFPPDLKNAVESWLALDPFNNPFAPVSPFQMKEYVVPESGDIAKYVKEIAEAKKAANEADDNSANYTLLSLVLSMVLFFSGLAGIAESNFSQRALLGVSSLIFAIAVFFIFRMPVML